MDMSDNAVKIELRERKETLNRMYEKFDKLKDEGKWTEAWKQLNDILTYANSTLTYTSEVLKEIVGIKTSNPNKEIPKKIDDLDSSKTEDKKPKRMIVIPKKLTIN